MRRSRLVTGIFAGLILATVPLATAQAAMPSRSTYTGFVTICDGVGPTERDAGPTAHLSEGYWYGGPEYFLLDNVWVESGTFRTIIDQSNWGAFGGVSMGTFEVRDGLLGDYDGTWAWNWGKGDVGHGVGQGIGSSVGSRVKIEFPPFDPVGLPDPPAGCYPGAYFYVVMSTF